jgi:hypothetical protein
MANIQRVEKLESTFTFIGEFCELKIVFLENETGAAVNVYNPQFKIERKIEEDKYEEHPIEYLVPLSPSSAKVGEYRTTFFTDTLLQGIYRLTFNGYYPDINPKNLITISSEFEVFEVSEFQSLITMLRIQLNDHRPSLYWIDNPDEYRWSDGELYNAFKMAMDKWNSTPPISMGNRIITKDNLLLFPLRNSIIEGAEFYALNQKYLLETFNKLTYSDDMSFTIDRAPGIMSKMQMLKANLDNLDKIKKDYVIRTSSSRAIKSTRVPLRALRQLSFIPQLSFLSAGGY